MSEKMHMMLYDTIDPRSETLKSQITLLSCFNLYDDMIMYIIHESCMASLNNIVHYL